MAADLWGDILIPAAGILVPTGIAIWLANRERTAASKQRQADADRINDERVALVGQERLAQRRRGVEAALRSMSDIVQAAYTLDFREEARIRIGVASQLPSIRLDLANEPDAVMEWVSRELQEAASALNHRAKPPAAWLPLHGDQIVWKSADMVSALTDYSLGLRDAQWFADDPFVKVEEMVKPADYPR